MSTFSFEWPPDENNPHKNPDGAKFRRTRTLCASKHAKMNYPLSRVSKEREKIRGGGLFSDDVARARCCDPSSQDCSAWSNVVLARRQALDKCYIANTPVRKACSRPRTPSPSPSPSSALAQQLLKMVLGSSSGKYLPSHPHYTHQIFKRPGEVTKNWKTMSNLEKQ